MYKRITLTGDDADVVTVRAATASTASRSCIRGLTLRNGDLNHDNQITPADAAIALRLAAAGGSASCDPTTLAAADVSGDGRVTSLDALMILKAAANAIEL